MGPGGSEASDLVGRDADLDRLLRWLDEGRSVVVTGPPGIGRTAVLAAAAARHDVALELRGQAALQPVPYLPLRLARPHLDVRADPAALASGVGSSLPTDAIVVVDDLQWCDADTRALVRELSLRRQVLAGTRAPWPPPAEELEGGGHGFREVLELLPLDTAAASTLVERLRPGAPASDRRDWVREAGGLPARLVDLAGGSAAPPAEPESDLPRALARDEGVRAVRLAAAGDVVGAARAARAAAAIAPTVWSRAEFLRLEILSSDPLPPDRLALAVAELGRAGRYRDALELLDRIGPDARTAATAATAARAAWATSDVDRARSEVAFGLTVGGATHDDEAELLAVRSRIAGQVDWDLPAALADAERAIELATPGGTAELAARSASGTARLISGDGSWRHELATASHLAAARDDVHSAVVLLDVVLFAHLLSGDARLCGPVADEMIELTEPASLAWNGYARAVALLVHVYVACDHRVVAPELDRLDVDRLTVKARQLLRHVQVLTALDAGRDLDAVELAALATAEADDDAARAAALYLTAEANWLAGEPERALAAVGAGRELPSVGHHRDTASALIGVWASVDLGRPPPEGTAERTRSGFPNLRGAQIEADALLGEPSAAIVAAFDDAAEAWGAANVRASLRCRWAAARAAAASGDESGADARLQALEAELAVHPMVWLRRRVDATSRTLGIRPPGGVDRTTAADVLQRVARGQTSAAIARSLVVSVPTVETHVRAAFRATGARNRVQAAATLIARERAAERPPLAGVRARDGRLIVRATRAAPPGREHELVDLPTVSWRLDGAVVQGAVSDERDVTNAVLAVARGADIAVVVAAGQPATAARLLEALERLGHRVPVEDQVGERPVLDDGSQRLLELLAEGATLDEAARALGYSRRTVQRRLEAARRQLGVTTNREAVIAARSAT